MNKNPTPAELRRVDQLIAFHLFRYRWYRYPHRPFQSTPLQSEVQPHVSLEIPDTHQEHYGAVMIDHPTPGDTLALDTLMLNTPDYHRDHDHVVELMEKWLELRHNRELKVWHNPLADGELGWCFGDTRHGFYPTLPMALAFGLAHEFDLLTRPTYF